MLVPASVGEEVKFYISSAQANFLAEPIAGLVSAGKNDLCSERVFSSFLTGPAKC